MKSDFLIALTQLAAERNLPREIVLSAIEAALVSAYKKDSIMAGQNISVKLDPGSGDVSVYVIKTVVEEVSDPQLEILLKDARKIRKDAQIDDVVPTDEIPSTAGRIAAQTAKQVVMQRLREAERELIFEEFEGKEEEVFSVTVQRVEPRQLVVDLGRAEATLPAMEQVPNERYRVGQKFKVLLQSVQKSSKGPELIVSRADSLFLKRLFEMEVPEIYNGAVEIMAIAREPGARSKVAVRARQDGVDPVGSCVGLRGVRIQNVVNELQGEKIDVMEWSKDVKEFIANALSPSQVLRVELDEDTQTATAVVPDRQLSLAIGKEGQNARLAAKLAGWKVDIRSNVEADAAKEERPKPEVSKAAVAVAEPVVGVEETPEELVEAEVATEEAEVEAPVVAEAEEAVPAPETMEAEGESEEQTAEEPVAEAEIVEEVEATEEEVPQTDGVEPVAEEVPSEPETAIEEKIEILPEIEEEAVPALGRSTSLRDLPENIWSVRRAGTSDPGRIRFAEDIAGLRGGLTARQNRRRDQADQPKDRRRKTKAGKAGKKRR